jgi:hypothetical protein
LPFDLLQPQKELDYVHYKRFNRILAFNEKKTILYLLCYFVLVLLLKIRKKMQQKISIALQSDRIIGQDQFGFTTSF